MSNEHQVPELDNNPLQYSSLANTMLVSINVEAIDDRASALAHQSDAQLAERVKMWWGTGETIKRDRDVRYLVAVLTGVKPKLVIGKWRTAPPPEWDAGEGEVKLVDPRDGDIGGHRWSEFDPGDYDFQTIGYSKDIR